MFKKRVGCLKSRVFKHQAGVFSSLYPSCQWEFRICFTSVRTAYHTQAQYTSQRGAQTWYGCSCISTSTGAQHGHEVYS